MANKCEKCGRPTSQDERYCAMCAPALKNNNGYLNTTFHSAGEADKDKALRNMEYKLTEIQSDVSFLKKFVIFLIVSNIATIILSVIRYFI